MPKQYKQIKENWMLGGPDGSNTNDPLFTPLELFLFLYQRKSFKNKWIFFSSGFACCPATLCYLPGDYEEEHRMALIKLEQIYPVTARKSHGQTKQEVAQLRKTKEIRTVHRKTSSTTCYENRKPWASAKDEQEMDVKHDLPFLNYLCPFHTRGDIYLNGQRNAHQLGRHIELGCRKWKYFNGYWVSVALFCWWSP